MEFKHSLSNPVFDRYFVGFDKIADKLQAITEQTTKTIANYPPYNLKKIGDDKYVIEMAVAGFGKQDLELTIADGKLIVSGKVEADDNNYLYKGIGDRGFKKTFTIADNVEIKSADLYNGLLKIWLDAIAPSVKQIEIKDSNETVSSPQFLKE